MPILIYITDAVNVNLVSGIHDWLIMQYLRADVSLNLINLSENLPSSSFQHGLFPDPVTAKLMCTSTGGLYLSPSDIITKSKLILEKRLIFPIISEMTDSNPKHYLDYYHVDLPIEILIQCASREGFQLCSMSEEKITYWFNLNYETKIEYSFSKESKRSSMAELNIICKAGLYKKLKKSEKMAAVFSKETKTSLSSRVLWVLQNVRETENVAAGLYKDIEIKDQKSIYDKISKLHVSKWHR